MTDIRKEQIEDTLNIARMLDNRGLLDLRHIVRIKQLAFRGLATHNIQSQLTAALNRVKELDVAQDKTWNEAIECALAHAETISPENSTIYRAIFGLRRAAEILKDVKP